MRSLLLHFDLLNLEDTLRLASFGATKLVFHIEGLPTPGLRSISSRDSDETVTLGLQD